jgi:hypothetical protein
MLEVLKIASKTKKNQDLRAEIKDIYKWYKQPKFD